MERAHGRHERELAELSPSRATTPDRVIDLHADGRVKAVGQIDKRAKSIVELSEQICDTLAGR